MTYSDKSYSVKLEKIKELIKSQFNEISESIFQGTITLKYLDSTERVYAEASKMYGLNIITFSESNFK